MKGNFTRVCVNKKKCISFHVLVGFVDDLVDVFWNNGGGGKERRFEFGYWSWILDTLYNFRPFCGRCNSC